MVHFDNKKRGRFEQIGRRFEARSSRPQIERDGSAGTTCTSPSIVLSALPMPRSGPRQVSSMPSGSSTARGPGSAGWRHRGERDDQHRLGLPFQAVHCSHAAGGPAPRQHPASIRQEPTVRSSASSSHHSDEWTCSGPSPSSQLRRAAMFDWIITTTRRPTQTLAAPHPVNANNLLGMTGRPRS